MTDSKLMRLKPHAAEFGRDLPADPMERLVWFARLAPSTHNTQPWRFVLARDTVDVFADLSRWLPNADRNRRELYVSLGCALESLLVAADYEGLGASTQLFPVRGDDSYVARVTLQAGGAKRDDAAGGLLHFARRRHTSHRDFDPARRLSEDGLRSLREAVDGEAVALHMMDGNGDTPVAALVGRAEGVLLADRAYREELGTWIGAGALGTRWLLSKLGQLAVTRLPVQHRVVQAEAGWLASAPHVGLLSTPDDSRASQVRAGQAYLRIALMCESRDMRTQPMSAPLELAETRVALAQAFGAGGRMAQQFFRIGHAEPEQQRMARRPLREVMVRAS